MEPQVTADTVPLLVAEHTGTFTDIMVTPEIARALLLYNTHNRSIRPTRVRRFVDIISTGRWLNTGEAVIMARRTLNEGQHRLAAIVEANIAVPLDIRFGISEEAFAVTGTGAYRTPGDTLSILGAPSANAIAAALKLVLNYDIGIPKQSAMRWRVGNDQIVESYARWPEISVAHRLVVNQIGHSNRLYSASIVAGAFLALRVANLPSVEDFVTIYGTGLTKDALSPPRMLREQMLREATLRNGTRESSTRKFALFIEAWNAWQGGDRPRELGWKYGNAFPIMSGVTL